MNHLNKKGINDLDDESDSSLDNLDDLKEDIWKNPYKVVI